MTRVDAGIVVAGGKGRRFGGADKPSFVLGDRTLLDHSVSTLSDAGADPIVVVGDEQPVSASNVVFVREDPPFGGLAAALGAGTDALAELAEADPGALVGVLAADLPHAGAIFEDLPQDFAGDGAAMTEDFGRPHWLSAVYRLGPLRAALDAERVDGSLDSVALRHVIAHMQIEAVEDVGGHTADIDTWDDVQTYDIVVPDGHKEGQQ